jgi:hypothetical protein
LLAAHILDAPKRESFLRNARAALFGEAKP